MADYLSFLKNYNSNAVGNMQAAGMGDPWHLENLAKQLETGGNVWGKYQTALGSTPTPGSTASSTPGSTASSTPGPAAAPVFDMPTITPESGTTTSNAVTGTTGQTSSGIDWGSPGVAGLLDQIKNWISTSSGLAQNVTSNIGNFYNNLMRESLGPQAFQGTLNDLRSRNMLNSSVASDALATAQSNIAGDIGNRAFDTYLKGYDTQMQMPEMLAQLANVLGGRAATSVDTGTVTGTVNDPMAVYRLLFDNII